MCYLQAVVDKVLALCDGNMLAAAIMGQALKKRPDVWQHVLDRLTDHLDSRNNQDIPQEYHNRITVTGAIAVAAESLSPAPASAFDMLRLLQVQQQLPLPLLQQLWGVVSDLAGEEDVAAPLSELVDASLLCKVSK